MHSPFQPNVNVDYFENNCLSFDTKIENRKDGAADKQTNNGHGNTVSNDANRHQNKKKKHEELSCNFKPTKGRILKTVDAVYQNITSLEECRLKCVNANFR